MQINEFVKKYSLVAENGVDIWKCHNNWILTHDACEKIAIIENIKLAKIDPIYCAENSVRFLITMVKEDEEGNVINSITSVGEADAVTCKTIKYYGAMAEKRGIDRCVLKLINAYQWGVYSEIEADSFSRDNGSELVIENNNEIISVEEKPLPKVEDKPNGEVKISNPVTFGKHNGIEWADVPQDYVEWCAGKNKVDWQKELANKELQRRTNPPRKKSGGMSEQDRVENSTSYADKDEQGDIRDHLGGGISTN